MKSLFYLILSKYIVKNSDLNNDNEQQRIYIEYQLSEILKPLQKISTIIVIATLLGALLLATIFIFFHPLWFIRKIKTINPGFRKNGPRAIKLPYYSIRS